MPSYGCILQPLNLVSGIHMVIVSQAKSATHNQALFRPDRLTLCRCNIEPIRVQITAALAPPFSLLPPANQDGVY